ncbi:MAG TPA: helix-turn-helix domain-containing protein [Dehalococcoidia bacterium]|nr:helix-turn-helix domain-containing protein [Dehalococcoidia bacterium]
MTEMIPGQRSERHDAVVNRARILAAAREQFATRGLEAEMKDIAAAADVGVGTLYRHFESRDGLVAALIEETRAELLGRVGVAAAGGPPAEAFRSILEAAADVHERYGALIEVAMAQTLDGADERRLDEFTSIMDGLLRRGVAEGAFRADLDVAVTRAMVESVFMSGKFVELARGRGYRAAADALASAFLAGMAAARGTA